VQLSFARSNEICIDILTARFAFQINAPNLEVTFIWKNEEERQPWYKDIKKILGSSEKNKGKVGGVPICSFWVIVFGVALKELVRRERTGDGIPNILRQLTKHLLVKGEEKSFQICVDWSEGLKTKELFQKNLSHAREMQLKSLIESEIADLSTLEITEIGAALHLFLSELPGNSTKIQSLMNTLI
jgi:hypothetical protein